MWAAIAQAALKIFGKFADKKAEQKKTVAGADAQRQADVRSYQAALANWDSKEKSRGAKIRAIQAMLQSGGGMAAGSPNYALRDEDIAGLSAPHPFPGAMPADPTKAARAGNTWALLGNLAGSAGSAAGTYGVGSASSDYDRYLQMLYQQQQGTKVPGGQYTPAASQPTGGF